VRRLREVSSDHQSREATQAVAVSRPHERQSSAALDSHMPGTRQRLARSFTAFTPTGQRVEIEEWVIEHNDRPVYATPAWFQTETQLLCQHGRVNHDNDVFTLETDGTVLTPE
jgi:hypothetical protein